MKGGENDMLLGAILCDCSRYSCSPDTYCGTGGNPHPYVGTGKRYVWDCKSGADCGSNQTGSRCNCNR